MDTSFLEVNCKVLFSVGGKSSQKNLPNVTLSLLVKAAAYLFIWNENEKDSLLWASGDFWNSDVSPAHVAGGIFSLRKDGYLTLPSVVKDSFQSNQSRRMNIEELSTYNQLKIIRLYLEEGFGNIWK